MDRIWQNGLNMIKLTKVDWNGDWTDQSRPSGPNWIEVDWIWPKLTEVDWSWPNRIELMKWTEIDQNGPNAGMLLA